RRARALGQQHRRAQLRRCRVQRPARRRRRSAPGLLLHGVHELMDAGRREPSSQARRESGRPPGIALVRFAIAAALLASIRPAPAAAISLTRGPYLQLLTTQSVTIVWNTDAPAACALAIRPT